MYLLIILLLCAYVFLLFFFFFFFFSSRRRHTRYIGDWSSDVCSSDLALILSAAMFLLLLAPASWAVQTLGHPTSGTFPAGGPASVASGGMQIGRASCRERVEVAVVGVS